MTIHHTARHQVKAPEAGKVKAAIAADAEYIANEPGSRMPTAWQKTTPPKFADAPERRFRAWALGRRLVPRSARINRYGAVPRPGEWRIMSPARRTYQVEEIADLRLFRSRYVTRTAVQHVFGIIKSSMRFSQQGAVRQT